MDHYLMSNRDIRKKARGSVANAFGSVVLHNFAANAILYILSFFAVLMCMISLMMITGTGILRFFAREADILDALQDEEIFVRIILLLFDSYTAAGLTVLVLGLLLYIFLQIVSSNVNLGLSHYYTKLTLGQNVSFGMIFTFFGKGILKAFRLCLATLLKVFIHSAAGYVPAFILWIVGVLITGKNPGIALMLLATARIFLMVGSILAIIAELKYSQAYFIIAEDSQTGVFDALRRSEKLMNGNKLRFLMLDLSFIGWLLLSLLAFGIGIIFVIPYINASHAVFYNDVTAKYDDAHASEITL